MPPLVALKSPLRCSAVGTVTVVKTRARLAAGRRSFVREEPE